ncbi:MAG: hypothetical protein WCR55_01735 [Lentisphaerota bacterium]
MISSPEGSGDRNFIEMKPETLDVIINALKEYSFIPLEYALGMPTTAISIPPYAERHVRWCERSVAELISYLLLD